MSDRRRQRHEETRAEIIAAAWDLARRDGLGALSLRDVAGAVGMRAPSLYNYFASKHAIYDAMFAEGYAALLALAVGAAPDAGDGQVSPEARFRLAARQFLEFCLDDPVRYQLLFQRTIPEFEPSTDAYALSQRALAELRHAVEVLDVADPSAAVDLWTAVMAGLTAQQISNDPGGDRWARLLDDAVDMFLAHVRATDDRRVR